MSCNEVELNNLKHVTADWSNPIHTEFTTTPFQPPHPSIKPASSHTLKPTRMSGDALPYPQKHPSRDRIFPTSQSPIPNSQNPRTR